jgi:hypothetical protein
MVTEDRDSKAAMDVSLLIPFHWVQSLSPPSNGQASD